MRKIKLAMAAAAVAAGLLAPTLAAGAANASTYTYSHIYRCVFDGDKYNQSSACFILAAYSTYTQTQVWINGPVYCTPTEGIVNITWCGVGGGNGTGVLNIGDDFNFSRNAKGSYYDAWISKPAGRAARQSAAMRMVTASIIGIIQVWNASVPQWLRRLAARYA